MHTHKIESPETVTARLKQVLESLSPGQVWVDPDCGLKTRTVDEAVALLDQARIDLDRAERLVEEGVSRQADLDQALPDGKKFDNAMQRINKQRADLGAYYNRLEHTAKGLMSAYENTVAAESRIRDADMAETMVEYSKNNILVQSGTAMLAQANTLPQTVLRLLQ